jgi:uncharacterized phage infection (PIP) family protein YhgE
MSITPTPLGRPEGTPRPQPSYAPAAERGSSSSLPLIALAVVTVIGIGGMYLYTKSVSDRMDQMRSTIDSTLNSQGETLQRLSSRLEKFDARATDLQGGLTAAQSRLGQTQSEIQKAHELAAALAEQQKQQRENAEKMGTQLNSQMSQLAQEQASTKGTVGSLSSDLSGVKGEVQSTKQELAATKSQLQSVVGDLGVQSGLIAHTRGDLDELRQRGERDYFEFDLRKENKLQRIAGVQLELKKTDPKKGKYTIGLVADDKSIEKKDKTVLEPVQFYLQGFRAPSEIVVNQVYKDRIVGYISMPKKKEDRPPMKAS